ncbi:MAG TPA: hemerythrin domain-containing protein [Acidimicrobiales bacterium]|nr:hemerythrin domain-containing protein [Acidimicrobiales bacterium]
MVDIDGDMNDVVALISADHAEIRHLFRELHHDTPTPGVHRNLVRDVLKALIVQSEAEHRTLYPAVEGTLGREQADRLRRDHDEVESLLAVVLGASDDDVERSALADLERVVTAHLDAEERDVLPQLAARLGIKRRSSLAIAYSQTTEAFTNVVVRTRRRAV